MHSTVTADVTDSDGETDSEEGEAEPAHQRASLTATTQPNGIAHQHTNGHAQPEAQLRHAVSSESEEENEDQEEEEDGGTQAMQVRGEFDCVLVMSALQCVCHATLMPEANHHTESCCNVAVCKWHACAVCVRQDVKHSI